MNRRRVTALLLTASFMASLTGCGNKGEVIGKVTEYADAVIAGDTDDIADLMEDEDEFLERLEPYLRSYTFDEDLNDVFDAVRGSMTYEIDKGSIRIDDDTATCDITYTLIDYWDIYRGLDEDPDTDDYLEALEDDPDNTFDIRQTIELELDGDEWKIVDEDSENILEVYEFYREIFGYGWIPIPDISPSDVAVAVESSLNVTLADYNYYDDPYYSNVYYYGEDIYTDIYIYTAPEDAVSNFDTRYGLYSNAVENGEFTGDSVAFYDGTEGFILLNGESAAAEFYCDEYVYGGIFLRDDTYIVVITSEPSDNTREEVDLILTVLGLPTPI